MLALKYFNDSGTYTGDWYRTFKHNGPFTGGSQPDHEGRAVVVAPVDAGSGAPSVFVTGVSSVSGAGRQFTTWRYKEE